MIEGCLAGGVRGGVSVPEQHWKSMTTLCGVVWLLLRRPDLRIVVMTHSHDKAAAMGKDLRELWKLAGGTTRKGFDTINEWQIDARGGGCVVMSYAISKLGYACDILLVDDALSDKEYMLTAKRDEVDEAIAFYTSRAATHLNCVLIAASRWHPDDPTGRRMRRMAVEWKFIQHSGIEGAGPDANRPLHYLLSIGAEAFAPEVLTLEQHVQKRDEMAELDPSLRIWWAQTQNEPLPDAAGFFTGERSWVGPVPIDVPTIYGVDAAFTAGTKSDHFACVGGVTIGDSLVVFDVIRHQRGLVAALATLCRLRDARPSARFVTYASGPEIGIYHAMFHEQNLAVEVMPARWNKAIRAQKTARSWQAGQVLTRLDQPWSGPYIAEMHAFDGREDGVDDQVDATVSLHDAIMTGRPAPGFGHTFTFGHRAV